MLSESTTPSVAAGIAFQRVLFPYAYNILGSAEDAKDVVQDVLAKHLSEPIAATVADPKSYLIKSVVNHAINTKKRLQRTLREGEVWLPEPVATADAADRNLQLGEVLSYSLLVLMERLSAAERAVFILRESFEYGHNEIAGVLGISEAHSRKLLSRAKDRLFKPAPKRSIAREQREREILDQYIDAIRNRDMQQLEGLMNADIRYYADGGGKVPLAASLCLGATAVAALQTMVYHKWLVKAKIKYIRVNHQPAFLYYKEEQLVACQVFEIHAEQDQLMQLLVVLDPAKLKNLPIG